MNFKNKKTNKKVKKRRTYKKYKGGDFTHGKKCSNVDKAIQALTTYIKKPFDWSIQLYDSTKCHLFIWEDEIYNPHIHVHTFSDREQIYQYTIKKKTYTVKLMGKDKIHYESVLIQMYKNLTGKTITDQLFTTPLRVQSTETQSTEAKPIKQKPKPSGLMADVLEPVQKKLEPILDPKKVEGSLL
jgi:hypothetical protein